MIKTFFLMVLSSFAMVFTAFAEEKAATKRVYVDVCADLMHPGHIQFFKNAKAFGDYLIVGIHSDEVISSYKRVPILTLNERVTMVEACRYVDEVVPGAPLKITEEWIQKYQIDVVVHGDDTRPETLSYWYEVPIRMGIFKTVPYTPGISTTDILKRITERYCPD